MTAPGRGSAERPRSAEGPWDLSFLRVGALATGAVAGVAALLTGLIAGWADAAGVLVGASVVTFFFCVSGLVIAWAGRVDDSWTLPAALGTFFAKAVFLYLVLFSLPEDGWLDRLTMAWSVVVGALLWSCVQLRWVWTRDIYYVAPPTPPRASPREAEKPPTRG